LANLYLSRSRVVDHLESVKGAYGICGVAYIYFNYKQQESQTPSLVYASLLAQLLQQMPDFRAPVGELYKKSDNGKKKPRIEELLNLLSNITIHSKVFLAFDALDEASDLTRTSLLKQLQGLENGRKSLWALMTSRPSVEIKALADNIKLAEVTARESDLRVFIRSQLEEKIGMEDIEDPQTIIQLIIQAVLSHAAGM
jgi:hypothetical protein